MMIPQASAPIKEGVSSTTGIDDRVLKEVKQPPRTPINPDLMYPDLSKYFCYNRWHHE